MRRTVAPGSTIIIAVIILASLFSCFSFVSAVAPVLSTVQQGSLEIIHPVYETHQVNKDFDFYWHVLNTTTLLTNLTSSCTFHLYSKDLKGEHIFSQTPVTKYLEVRDFEVDIKGGNFSTAGDYCYLVECNTTRQTGAQEVCFRVITSNVDILLQNLYIYIIGLVFLVMLIFGSVYIIGSLPSKDAQDEAGSIVHVSQLKHLRSVLWVVVWGLSLAIVFILSNISLAYLTSPMMGDLFFALYKIMFWMTIVGVPIYIIWIIYKVFKDAEMKRLIERGVEMRGTP